MSAATPYMGLRALASALLLALLCQGCAKPARVVLYEQRHPTTTYVQRHPVPAYEARRGARSVDAPVPPAKPRAAKRGSIEVSRLAPPGHAARPAQSHAQSRPTKSAARETQIAARPLSGSTVTRSFDKSEDAASHYRPVPKNGIHVVTPKETVYALSRMYGVPVRSLLVLNKLNPPYLLQTGQKVRIPPQRTHVVAKGETVYAISRQFDVSLTELVRLNGIKKPFTIVTGQTLLLPDTQRTTVATEAPTSEGDAALSEKDNTRGRQSQLAETRPPAKRVVLPPSTNIPEPRKLSRYGFLWPVRGKVISRFGPKAKGLHNDGINIAAPRGTPIRAAQHGVVAYSGNELRGFGNLILIKHAKGYMTAYAHASKILVKRGARVRRGEIIGRVGSSGSVAGPQLHFEIRRGRRPVDPLRYLSRQRAARSGAVQTAQAPASPRG